MKLFTIWFFIGIIASLVVCDDDGYIQACCHGVYSSGDIDVCKVQGKYDERHPTSCGKYPDIILVVLFDFNCFLLIQMD